MKYDILRKQPKVSPIVTDYIKPEKSNTHVVELEIVEEAPQKVKREQTAVKS